MKFQKNLGNRGFTLVELMIVIVIIGVLAALASYGFVEYVKKSKSAEADEFVKKIGDGAKVYYTKEQRFGGDETWHAVGSGSEAAGMPVPGNQKTFPGGTGVALMWTGGAQVPTGGGKIVPDYSSRPADARIWGVLNFTSTDPTYFTYGYQTGSDAGPAASACVIAEANFDSDSTALNTDCTAAQASHANQTLVKKLTVVGGDVQASPAVLTNQGK